MRVLQVPPRYAPHVGGVEAVAQRYAEGLAAGGDVVSVLCADEPRGAPAEVRGIPIRRLGWRAKLGNTNLALGLPRALLASDADVVHAHLPTPWWADWAVLIGRLRRQRVVLTFYNQTVGHGIDAAAAWLYRATVERATLRLAHVVMVQSEPWAERLRQRLPADRVRVVPNGVDLERFSPPPAGQARSSDLLFVSVLDDFHRYKGLDVLIAALASVPGVVLHVVGDGALRTGYEAQSRQEGVADRVIFQGAVDDDVLLGLYREVGAFVLSSNAAAHEGGSSLVVLEAMSCGLPVVVAEGAGEIARQVARAGAGRCVPAGDAAALATALREVTGDAHLRDCLGAAARRHVELHHGWDSVVAAVRQCYEV